MRNEAENSVKKDWQKIIEDQERSGLSQAEFCRQHELDLAKFGYHRGRLKVKQKKTSKLMFNSIKISSSPTTTEEIKITLPNGFQCVFPSQIDSMQIKKIIEILLSC